MKKYPRVKFIDIFNFFVFIKILFKGLLFSQNFSFLNEFTYVIRIFK